MALSAHHHGKRRVRVARTWRDGAEHQFREWQVGTELLSDLEGAYTEGNNTGMPATDTQKNTVYWIAKQFTDPCSPEEFAVALAKQFVLQYEKVTKARVVIEQSPWERVTVDGHPHGHGFIGGSEVRTADVSYGEDGNLEIKSGIKDLRILKTTQSGYEGYIRDEFTTLPETQERILSTSMTAKWEYCLPMNEYDSAFDKVKKALLESFFGHPQDGVYSPSVQYTLYQMAKNALEKVSSLKMVTMSLPNLHFLPCNPVMGKFEDDVYVATSEPYGIIEATIVREANT